MDLTVINELVNRGGTDKTLAIGDKKYNVIADAFAKRSGYFKSMFNGEFQENKTHDDIDLNLPFSEHFDHIYWFLLTGKKKFYFNFCYFCSYFYRDKSLC